MSSIGSVMYCILMFILLDTRNFMSYTFKDIMHALGA